jgi:hypothetical protein
MYSLFNILDYCAYENLTRVCLPIPRAVPYRAVTERGGFLFTEIGPFDGPITSTFLGRQTKTNYCIDA